MPGPGARDPVSILLIGCPKTSRRRDMIRPAATRWVGGPPGTKGCRFTAGPHKGEAAGTRVHAVIQATRGGRCRVGYKRGRV